MLGLVGLSITIRSAFTRDISTAWYAVSLLPRTVVAGQGVRIWLSWPIISTAIVLPVALITFSSPSTGGQPDISFWVWVLNLLVPLIIAAIAASRIGRQQRQRSRTHGLGRTGRLLTLYFGTQVISSGIISVAITDTFVIGGVLVFFGGFIVGVPAAIAVDPPLPRVRITGQPGTNIEGVSNPINGHLVTHSDGFWYFFDENDELLSIPDDKVLVARIVREEALTP